MQFSNSACVISTASRSYTVGNFYCPIAVNNKFFIFICVTPFTGLSTYSYTVFNLFLVPFAFLSCGHADLKYSRSGKRI